MAQTKYLYYVIKPCSESAHAFSATYARIPARLGPLRTRAAEARWPLARDLLSALAGVLGYPVSHSRSPAMMAAAFAELGLDWRYFRLPVPPELFGNHESASRIGYVGADT